MKLNVRFGGYDANAYRSFLGILRYLVTYDQVRRHRDGNVTIARPTPEKYDGPALIQHWPNVLYHLAHIPTPWLMLARHRRRWANFKPTFAQRLVSDIAIRIAGVVQNKGYCGFDVPLTFTIALLFFSNSSISQFWLNPLVSIKNGNVLMAHIWPLFRQEKESYYIKRTAKQQNIR